MRIEELNTAYRESNGTINLVSFQSKEVLDLLLNEGVYVSDVSKSREKRDYSLDINQLGFADPIWCFSPKVSSLNYKDYFDKEDFIDGSLFFNYKCEMSINYSEEMNSFYLLDLEVPSNMIRVGLTHNAYEGAVVIPYIKKEYLRAIYRMKYDRSRELGWYYPKVYVENIYKENSLFRNNFLCREEECPSDIDSIVKNKVKESSSFK